MKCIPGLHFYHNGEFEGFKIRTNVHLKRKQREEISPQVSEFYDKLLQVTSHSIFRNGECRLLASNPAWDGNISNHNFINLLWTDSPINESPPVTLFLVVVNYSMWPSQCFVPFLSQFALSSFPSSPTFVILEDLMKETKYERNFGDLLSKGLFVDLPSYEFHIFKITFAF